MVCNHGLEVDDNNQPAPENVPEGNQPPIMTKLYPDRLGAGTNTKNDTRVENGWTPVGKLSMDIF